MAAFLTTANPRAPAPQTFTSESTSFFVLLPWPREDPRWALAMNSPDPGKDAVMVRDRLFVSLCAGVAARPRVRAVWLSLGEDAESKLRTQLAVQTALQQGRDNLQRGEYQAAVYCLEKEIARVDGNRDYMNALREAYRGYIRELQQTNRHAEGADLSRTAQDPRSRLSD